MDHEKAIRLAEHYVLFDRGERALDALKHASPESPWTWLWRANALHQVRRYEEAIEAARSGLAFDPESSYLHHALARGYFMLSRFEEAEAAIVESLRLRPDEPEALAYHALIASATGRRHAGEQIAARAVELAPELRGVRLTEALLSLQRGRDTSDALTSDLLHAEPEGAEEHWMRGIAYLQRARFREAASHFTCAAALKPENPMFVRAARIARHWIFWPLRITSPYSIWIAWHLLIILIIVGVFAGGDVWTFVGYCVAFLLYALVGMLSIITQPFTRDR